MDELETDIIPKPVSSKIATKPENSKRTTSRINRSKSVANKDYAPHSKQLITSIIKKALEQENSEGIHLNSTSLRTTFSLLVIISFLCLVVSVFFDIFGFLLPFFIATPPFENKIIPKLKQIASSKPIYLWHSSDVLRFGAIIFFVTPIVVSILSLSLHLICNSILVHRRRILMCSERELETDLDRIVSENEDAKVTKRRRVRFLRMFLSQTFSRVLSSFILLISFIGLVCYLIVPPIVVDQLVEGRPFAFHVGYFFVLISHILTFVGSLLQTISPIFCFCGGDFYHTLQKKQEKKNEEVAQHVSSPEDIEMEENQELKQDEESNQSFLKKKIKFFPPEWYSQTKILGALQFFSAAFLLACVVIFFGTIFFLYIVGVDCPQDPLKLESFIRVPTGFFINSFVQKTSNARSMALNDNSTMLFIGTRTNDRVYAVVSKYSAEIASLGLDSNLSTNHYLYSSGDRLSFVISKGLDTPNGIAFKNGSLFVAERTRLLRFDHIQSQITNAIEKNVPKSQINSKEDWYSSNPIDLTSFISDPVLVADFASVLSTKTHHGWKYIRFSPLEPGYLYMSIGAPCNACEKEGEFDSTIVKFNVNQDPVVIEIVAEGVRNSVGFDWNPENGDFCFTENGRDWIGNGLPKDELNCIPAGTTTSPHFGFPFCHSQNLPDPDFNRNGTCEGGMFEKPKILLDSHAAAVGMTFYRGTMFPSTYQNVTLIAEHGSWNRYPISGYRVALARLNVEDSSREDVYTSFTSVWGTMMHRCARPVDIVEMGDGSILVSDDLRGGVYRIHY